MVIRLIDKEVFSTTKYYNVEIVINNKPINLTVIENEDTNIRYVSLEFHYVEESDIKMLSDEEHNEIHEWVHNGKFYKK